MFNFGQNEWTSIIYKLLLIGIIFMSLFIRTKNDRILKLKQLGIWLFIIFFGAFIYNKGFRFRDLIPFAPKSIEGENAFEINKSNDGHFYIMLNVSGINTLFMIDTGASFTTLTIKDAKRLGVDIEKLSFKYPVNTANGKAFNAKTNVDYIKIDGFLIKENLEIFVSRELNGDSLLGMNFLQSLKGYKVEKDKMIIFY